MKPRTTEPRLVGKSGREFEDLSIVHAQSFAKAWSPAAVREMLEMPGAFALALDEDGRAAGFILLRMAVDEAEIITFAVLPSARARGLGRTLLDAAGRHANAQGARSLVLEVDRANAAALRLYRIAGFEELGVRSAYYGASRDGPGDALIMRARLPLRALGNRDETD